MPDSLFLYSVACRADTCATALLAEAGATSVTTGQLDPSGAAAAKLRAAVPTDGTRIAQILIDVRSSFMPYAPLVHSPQEVRSWVRGLLTSSRGIVVAESDGNVVGVMVVEREVSCSWITQMAVDPAHVGRGIGSALLQHAFRNCRSPIRLYTFQPNVGARRFYERHGFRIVRLSDGRENEERCPDVLYEFVPSAPG